ncbi:MAG: type VII secretion protein EccCb, partial [Micromonosporaceae bacterium]
SYRPGEDDGQPVWIDFSQGSGHLLVVGRLGSGKSVMLSTLATGLALTHGPDEIGVYALEAASNRLGAIGALPHLRTVTGDDEAEQVDALLSEVELITRTRQKLFRSQGIDSLASYRAWRAGEGATVGGDHADLFLLIDGWQAFGRSEQFTARVRDLASAGPGYGVHLVVTSRWWEAVPPDLVHLLQSHVELRLDEPQSSRIDPDAARALPDDASGWGLHLGRRFQIAVPRIDRTLTRDVAPDGSADLVHRLVEAWPGGTHPAVSELPPEQPEMVGRPEKSDPGEAAAGTPAGSRQGHTWLPEVEHPDHRPGPGGFPSGTGGHPVRLPGGPGAGSGAPGGTSPGGFRPDQADGRRSASTPRSFDVAEVLDLGDPHRFDPQQVWRRRRREADRLRLPIGQAPDGRPVEVDLKQSAQDGMGPHGLVVGAPGSGKRELLRSLVLGLAATHDPEWLNLLLVDFGAGAAFTTLDRLPHTSAVLSNLRDDLSLVDRMREAISGELVRRQQLLRHSGNYASHRDYEKAYAAGTPLLKLPALILVFDEFSELLAAMPDFVEVFIQIGRLGRSLGVHLLLASQHLEEGLLRGLGAHLSYRIALRTYTAMESRVLLGVPDAFELPHDPGDGYLKHGNEPPVRFRAAYSSGPAGSSAGDDAPAGDTGGSLSDVLVSRLEGSGAPAHPIWLPPLDEPPTLDQLTEPPEVVAERGLTAHAAADGALRAVGGTVDLPFEQAQEPLELEFAGAAGHALVAGAPQSGKSTLLRTLITSLALSHTPQQAQFYCLDFGGGSLVGLRDLPHVGGVATRLDVNTVRRTVAQISTLMDAREQDFLRHGIDGINTYRRRRLEGDFADDPYGDVFLVIDGWHTVRQEYEDLEPVIAKIANRGLGLGIHLIGTATRWMDVRPAVRDLFGTQLELRLGDPSDSVVNRKAARNVPEGAPGRGLTPDGLHFLSAVPRIDGRQTTDDLAEGVADLVDRVRGAWAGTVAPKVRLLPAMLPYQDLPRPGADAPPGVPIGIAEHDLRPVFLDFSADPHLLLFGDVESGKSSFLRTLARGITDRYSPEQARMLPIDYRRSLLGAISEEHRLGYGTSSQVTADLIAQVVTVMKERLPGPEITPEQLRERSWWSGPDVYILIDDYDLVASPASNPLLPLQDFIALARDIGLHLIVVRRMGGAGRAMFDPMISRIREVASPGIMMSGDRSEGALLGNMKPQILPPGRGWLVTRREGTRLIQIAWEPPPGERAGGASH